jgi:chromosome segregation ATPase
MATLEERVAYLEGKVEEHSHAFLAIRDAIARLEQRMDARFDAIDRRFEAVDRRFNTIDRHFVWMVGIQVTSILALMTVLFARS